MNLEHELNQVYACLVQLRAGHPHGLRAIGSGNAHEVLTRFGVDGHVAESATIALEYMEEHGGMQNPMELVELLRDTLNAPDWKPFDYNVSGVKPGQKDDRGLFTHPTLLFTACNHNGRPYGIEADASQSPGGGLEYYQDWRDAQEIKSGGSRIITCWDAVHGRFLTDSEISSQFPHQSHN